MTDIFTFVVVVVLTRWVRKHFGQKILVTVKK